MPNCFRLYRLLLKAFFLLKNLRRQENEENYFSGFLSFHAHDHEHTRNAACESNSG